MLNNPEALLRMHYAEHNDRLVQLHRHRGPGRRSFTTETRVHHAVRAVRVNVYRRWSHARRAVLHAGHAIAHPSPV